MERSYKKLYFLLFSAISQACDALEMGDILNARKALIEAMRQAEEAHLEQDILPDQ